MPTLPGRGSGHFSIRGQRGKCNVFVYALGIICFVDVGVGSALHLEPSGVQQVYDRIEGVTKTIGM
jgi:hypothetical protein